MDTKKEGDVFRRGQNAGMDQEFGQGAPYGKVKIGQEHIFWKKGLRWYQVEVSRIRRAYRRVEAVDTKMCCGNANFDIQKLILVLDDDTRLELLIGDGMPREGEALYQEMKNRYPQLQYGKPQEAAAEI
ncbi:MAG: hypothetical protein Q4E91_02325 [Lachnospiraceae bacterium]|nr:hypothetical protein [Lachnospiraceae bacterium]